MNIFIVRHGEREDKQQNGVWTGGLDPGITKLGISQALLVGETLRKENIDYIYSSPFYRTVLTAVEVAFTLGLKVRVENGLSETLLQSMYPKQPEVDPKRAISEGMKAYMSDDYTSPTRFPKYPEDELSARVRVCTTVDRLIKNHQGETMPSGKPANIVLVTHLHAVQTATCYLSGTRQQGKVSYGCLTHLRYTPVRKTWDTVLAYDEKHLKVSLGRNTTAAFDESTTTVTTTTAQTQYRTPPPSEVAGVRKGVKKRKKANLPEQLAINATEVRRLEAELLNAKQRRTDILKKIAMQHLKQNKVHSNLCILWVVAPQVCAHVLSYLQDTEFLSLLQTTKIVKACLKEELSGLTTTLTPSVTATTFLSSQCTSIRDSLLKDSTLRSPDRPSVILRAKKLFDDDETWDQNELALIRDTIDDSSLEDSDGGASGCESVRETPVAPARVLEISSDEGCQWTTPTSPTMATYSPGITRSGSKARTIAAIVSSDNCHGSWAKMP
eukprot:TRINITY_DN2963_c6_g1_i1.p1 TRINITY_DN2963_c6_g1~~TRINITY_DN2963_c6_g1_i1.p1  ORF type:complete len:498 (+),score=40.61 TRINITY_DN2963_c6_g1_i1:46-1539(+)